MIEQEQDEKKQLLHSLRFPFLFMVIIWLVWFVEFMLDLDFATWGLFPRKWSGLRGILTAPLIHADIRHLVDNSIPLFTLMAAIFYFYRPLALRIFCLTYIMAGLWVWVGGREAYHIGASGLIYGFASFLFLSGILRNHIPLMAISLLVVFLYGSLVWGIFPLEEQISWESHLLGAVAGLILAIHYRSYGPQRKPYSWELDDDDTAPKDEEPEEKNSSDIHPWQSPEK